MVASFEALNEENFAWYAMNNYNNPQCSHLDEFFEDLNRFKYIKRLLGRYAQSNDLQERLLLNHITIIINVFGVDPAIRMLQYKFPADSQWAVIEPFLLYLRVITSEQTSNIPYDFEVVNRLRKI